MDNREVKSAQLSRDTITASARRAIGGLGTYVRKSARTLLIALVVANIAAFGYIRYAEGRMATREQFAALHISAHKMNLIRTLPEEWRPAAELKISLNLGMPPAERKEKPAVLPRAETPTACLEWGTFAASEMPRAVAALTQLGLNERLAPEDNGEREWWVYIPPRASKAEADKKVVELKALGVNDLHIVQHDAKYRYAISLGTFRSEEGANNYLHQLKLKRVRSATVGGRRPASGVFTVRESAEAEGNWWVFIPRPTKAEIDKKAAEVRALGLTDFVVVKADRDAGYAVSFGIFSSEEGAEQRLAELREQKVRSAVIGPRGAARNVVVIPDPGDAVVGKLTELRKNFPAVTLVATACSTALAGEKRRRPAQAVAARPPRIEKPAAESEANK